MTACCGIQAKCKHRQSGCKFAFIGVLPFMGSPPFDVFYLSASSVPRSLIFAGKRACADAEMQNKQSAFYGKNFGDYLGIIAAFGDYSRCKLA